MRSRSIVIVTALALGGACASSKSGEPEADAAGPVDAAVDGAAPVGDGFPKGAIGFFMTTFCPAGWTRYTDLVGRTVVPTGGTDAGAAIGAAYQPNEERPHRHDLAVSADLPSVSYAGIAGEANHGVARAGAVTGSAPTDDGAAAIPYAQFLACRKTAGSSPVTVPGIVFFVAEASCPAPWVEAPAALRGRFLVAAPAGATAGRTFGGEPLAPGEQRTHGHTVAASLAAGSHGIALASGCCAGGYGRAGSHGVTARAEPAAADVPYLQLLACTAP